MFKFLIFQFLIGIVTSKDFENCIVRENGTFIDVQVYHVHKTDHMPSSFSDGFFNAICDYGVSQVIDIPCLTESNDSETHEQRRKCYCDKITEVLNLHQNNTIIILFVEEALNYNDQQVCAYTASSKSPLFLQVFASGKNTNEFALISMASPAGHTSFQIRQKLFDEHFKTVVLMMDTIYNQNLINVNTVRKSGERSFAEIVKAYQDIQAMMEKLGTSVAYIHLALGIFIMILAMLVGYFTTDQSVLINFDVVDVTA